MITNILIGVAIIVLYMIYGLLRYILEIIDDICNSVLATQLENQKEKLLKKDIGDE